MAGLNFCFGEGKNGDYKQQHVSVWARIMKKNGGTHLACRVPKNVLNFSCFFFLYLVQKVDYVREQQQRQQQHKTATAAAAVDTAVERNAGCKQQRQQQRKNKWQYAQ